MWLESTPKATVTTSQEGAVGVRAREEGHGVGPQCWEGQEARPVDHVRQPSWEGWSPVSSGRGATAQRQVGGNFCARLAGWCPSLRELAGVAGVGGRMLNLHLQ